MKNTQNILLAVDAVVFGYDHEQLFILLIKRKFEPFKNKWAIPGGFVKNNESLESAVERELLEETNVKINYLEQLYTFGAVKRDPRQRVVAISYFGLVRSGQFELKADTDAVDAQWFNTSNLPPIAFDHKVIVQTAIDRLRSKLVYEPIGFELLNKKFLFSELEHLYMTILDRQIDRRNFRKKILKLGFLKELNEKIVEGRGRPASLFQFDAIKYQKLKKEGFHLEIV